ncbi:MAG: hypothetical protein JKY09_05015 [Crocinitomicaceae bacterium]|nr:hypothetical protein [Crocinitomicaceae bacterium]
MNFKPDFGTTRFKKITVDAFVTIYKKNNPNTDMGDLKKNLTHYKTLKLQGQKCDCGNPIRVIGSAISGQGCFTCITGETDSSNDYEIK